jgi:hypothetical protein
MVCGGYLDCAWARSCFVDDEGRRSFIFTLRNHLEVPPTRFEQTPWVRTSKPDVSESNVGFSPPPNSA